MWNRFSQRLHCGALFSVLKNYATDIAEFVPGELYTDQYKVKVNDLGSWSRSWYRGHESCQQYILVPML